MYGGSTLIGYMHWLHTPSALVSVGQQTGAPQQASTVACKAVDAER